ncbi:MAG: hypothetical protein FWD53_13470 [Phycisphaerales bacterium]|nr:hypothetical protein [Phycisphaerales bacterium]
MASSQGIKAGSAFIELLVNDKALVKGLRNASKKLKAFGDSVADLGKKLAMIGTAVAAPLVGFAKVFASGSKELQTLSQRTGISVEALSELGYAASISGTNMQTLEGGIKKMQRTIYMAATGSKTATAALAQLGLTVDDLRGLSPDAQFKLIADKLAAIQSPAVRAAMAMAIFGKSGMDLLPMMSRGAAGIDAMQEEARRLGLTSSEASVAIGVKLAEALSTLWMVLKQVGTTLGEAVAPLLTDVANRIIDIAVKAINWAKQNKELIVTIFKVAVGVVAAGIALLVLGKAIVVLGGVLSALATAVGVVTAVIGVLGGIIGGLLSPIGLVVAAVAALGAYLIYASGMGGKALSWLGERFLELSAFATEAFGGIADALAAGDIALAAKILWLTLKVAWQTGISALETLWTQFKGSFVNIIQGAFYGALAAWEICRSSLEVAWVETTAFLSKTWTSFTSGFQQAWNSAINWTTKRLLELWSLFDDSFDVNEAKTMADKELAETNNQIEAQKKQALAQRESQRKQERKTADDAYNYNMAQIGQAAMDAEDKLAKEQAEKIKKSNEELEKARDEWRDAIGKARDKRTMKDAQGPDRLEPPPAIRDYLEGLGATIEQAQKKTVGVSGTFNAMAAAGMQGGGVADRIAKATEETARNTKKLLDQNDDSEFD